MPEEEMPSALGEHVEVIFHLIGGEVLTCDAWPVGPYDPDAFTSPADAAIDELETIRGLDGSVIWDKSECRLVVVPTRHIVYYEVCDLVAR